MPLAPGDTATVLLHGAPIGHLWTSQGTHHFELSSEYLETARRPVLGQVFEEFPRRRWRQAQRLPPWFSNLLPEGRLRDLIAAEHEISPRNEFRLMVALGSDLPGAIQVIPVPYPDSEIRRVEGGSSSTSSTPRTGATDETLGDPLIRFSIAGVQVKLSMLRSGNTLTLPGRGRLGDHLVKLPSRQYPGVPENEYSMMSWASATGIDTPECDLRPVDDLASPLPAGLEVPEGHNIYIVRRFDRSDNTRTPDKRNHMEDLNQVVDNWPEAKYEGASYERLGRILFVLCGEGDFLEYVRRLTFCIAIGNEDAHLKNWTIRYPDRIQPRLSPAYDLVSTIQYPELDRKLALKLGRTRYPSRFTPDTMKRLADGTDIDPDRVVDTVRQTLESMRDSWTEIGRDLPVAKAFRDRLRKYQRSVPLLRPYAI